MPKDAGYVFITNRETGKTVENSTLQCGHCGKHWQVVKGSGRKRGFCTICMKPTCGPNCLVGTKACVPQEQLVSNIEQGRPFDFRPIVVSNPGIILG